MVTVEADAGYVRESDCRSVCKASTTWDRRTRSELFSLDRLKTLYKSEEIAKAPPETSSQAS